MKRHFVVAFIAFAAISGKAIDIAEQGVTVDALVVLPAAVMALVWAVERIGTPAPAGAARPKRGYGVWWRLRLRPEADEAIRRRLAAKGPTNGP